MVQRSIRPFPLRPSVTPPSHGALLGPPREIPPPHSAPCCPFPQGAAAPRSLNVTFSPHQHAPSSLSPISPAEWSGAGSAPGGGGAGCSAADQWRAGRGVPAAGPFGGRIRPRIYRIIDHIDGRARCSGCRTMWWSDLSPVVRQSLQFLLGATFLPRAHRYWDATSQALHSSGKYILAERWMPVCA